MKTNEAPEKIYLFENPVTETPDDRWLSKRSDENDIEYVCKDAFIEKAVKFFTPHIQDNSGGYDRANVIENFRNYMKGE